MLQQVSAFLEKEIPCPVCGEETNQQKLKAKLYSSAEQESDQHVTRWTWTDPEFESIKPQFYPIMHCPKCYYTDIAMDYETPSGDMKFGGIKRAFKGMRPEEAEFLKKLSPFIFVHPMTFESAMNAHIAAIFIQELPKEAEYKNLVKLGRLYLRTAWLWREKAPQSKASQSSSVLADIERAVIEMEKPLPPVEQRLETLQNLLIRRIKSLGLTPDEEKTHPYQKVLNGFQKSLGEIHQNFGRLRQFMQDDAAGTLNSASSSDQNYGEYPSYFDFLSAMGEYYPKIIVNEREALKQAVKYFTDAYFMELNFDEVEKVMTTNALIVDLHLRLDDFDSALKAIGSVYKAGTDGKMGLQKQLREGKKDGKMSDKDQMRIESQLSRIEHVLMKTAERRHEVRALKFQSYVSRIETVIGEQKSKRPEDLEVALADAGIPEDMIEMAQDKGVLDVVKSNKEAAKAAAGGNGNGGGFFGIFGKKAS